MNRNTALLAAVVGLLAVVVAGGTVAAWYVRERHREEDRRRIEDDEARAAFNEYQTAANVANIVQKSLVRMAGIDNTDAGEEQRKSDADFVSRQRRELDKTTSKMRGLEDRWGNRWSQLGLRLPPSTD